MALSQKVVLKSVVWGSADLFFWAVTEFWYFLSKFHELTLVFRSIVLGWAIFWYTWLNDTIILALIPIFLVDDVPVKVRLNGRKIGLHLVVVNVIFWWLLFSFSFMLWFSVWLSVRIFPISWQIIYLTCLFQFLKEPFVNLDIRTFAFLVDAFTHVFFFLYKIHFVSSQVTFEFFSKIVLIFWMHFKLLTN